jgi:hypothetical protein
VTVINSDNGFDIVWGAEAIGQVIGRSARATFHMLENGRRHDVRPVRRAGPEAQCALLLEPLPTGGLPSTPACYGLWAPWTGRPLNKIVGPSCRHPRREKGYGALHIGA